MTKLTARRCETAKPDGTAKDQILGDGDGLFLRVRPNGTKTWLVEYEFRARRRKYRIGIYDAAMRGPVCSITWKCFTTGSDGTHRLATRPRYRSRR
jgi:hypothetical protein